MPVAVHTSQDRQRAATYLERGWWRDGATYDTDFQAWARRRPTHAAIVSHHVDSGVTTTLTFRDLAARVEECVGWLTARGVGAGDVVSFQLPNSWQFTALTFACARLGAIVHPVLPIHREREIRYSIGVLSSALCVVDRRLLDDAREVVYGELATPVLALDGLADGASWGALSEGFIGSAQSFVPRPQEVAQVQFTSGTTGAPKGVVHTFNTLFAAYRATQVAAALGPEDVILAPSTMAHQTAFLSGCIMPPAEGMTAVYLDRWDPTAALELICTHGVTFASAATPFMSDLATRQEHLGLDINSLRSFKSGGAAVPDVVRRQVRDVLGAEVLMAWGMTENGVCTMARPGGGDQQADGSPLPWVELRVTDRSGAVLPAGEVGVLRVRSASQCIDYFPGHDEYRKATDDGGWFDTGDLAEIRSDGTVRIAGRVKDMVIRGGENIPVVEVENALLEHPAIAHVAVVGLPDSRLGERACAVVVLHEGAALELSDVREHLSGMVMAKQYWPESVVLVRELPRTTTGKVQKNELRERLLTIQETGA